MKTNFCPLCKSLMIDGVCSNKKCGNSQLEIDFNEYCKHIKINKKYENVFNNSYVIETRHIVGLDKSEHFKLDLTNLYKEDIRIDEKVIFITDTGGFISVKIKDVNTTYAQEITRPKYKYYVKTITTTYNSYNVVKERLKVSNRAEKRRIKKISSKPIRLEAFYGSNDLVHWYCLDKEFKKDDTQVVLDFISTLTSNKAYKWTVICSQNGFSIKYFLEKEQAYRIFKDRDIKVGKKKRTALKQIIDEYERKKPKQITVKEHFRGDMVFQWRGITFTLIPPQIAERRILNNESEDKND